MRRHPVIYRLEAQRFEGAVWDPVLDAERKPLTWTGSSGKPQALMMAEIVRRYPVWWGVRVKRNTEVVQEWTRKDGQTS